jgi:phosphoglycolate phosphatase-like HAD superfamily hydrolase
LTQSLVLFDIDGTLLSAGGISARSLGQVLREVFGTDGYNEDYDYSGKTDPQIVRELMRGAGFDDATIDKRLPETLSLYTACLLDSLRPEHVAPKPGVAPLVAALARKPHVSLGLLTGNLEPCARTKLRPLGLNGAFAFGAYGSDHEDRYRLPPVAVKRALEHTGRRFDGKEVIIVGDSVHDVRCGRSLGVRAVAVATGRTSREVLAAEDPDALVVDFSDVTASLRAILGAEAHESAPDLSGPAASG